ncbi:MAG: rRNA maturation RNase YbeY [Chloroflexi bacterium]|nr:rRNA maturation RNase YbeY [Chloroflexota bacterium]
MTNINLDYDKNVDIDFNECELISLVTNIFKYLKIPSDTELNILLSDNKTIKELNSRYRGLNEAKDVLSFSYTYEGKYYGNKQQTDTDNINFPKSNQITSQLGDLIISVEYIKNQNTNDLKIINKEIKKLLLHGILHLNGFDHENDEDTKIMNETADSIIKQLKI